MLDTSEYICENPDGNLDTYHTNTIVENLWSQCNNNGNEFLAYKEILDHRKNYKAVAREDGYVKVNGDSKPKRTTAGWEILVSFTNGETQWLPLQIVKKDDE